MADIVNESHIPYVPEYPLVGTPGSGGSSGSGGSGTIVSTVSGYYLIHRTGPNVEELLDQVANKTIYPDVTYEEHGLMSAADKIKLDTELIQKVPTATSGNIAMFNSTGSISDTGYSVSDIQEAIDFDCLVLDGGDAPID